MTNSPAPGRESAVAHTINMRSAGKLKVTTKKDTPVEMTERARTVIEDRTRFSFDALLSWLRRLSVIDRQEQ